MTVSIDVDVGRRERALVLPIDAVDTAVAGAPPSVLVVREGRVVRVPVVLGLRGIDRVEVLEGLSEGEAVLPVVGAPAEGARVRIADAE
jgi:HlyD family secretion protein